jgi:hypothetical protein
MNRDANVFRLERESLRLKTCQACGERIVYSRRSAPEWSRIEYCSAACRRAGVARKRIAANLTDSAAAL